MPAAGGRGGGGGETVCDCKFDGVAVDSDLFALVNSQLDRCCPESLARCEEVTFWRGWSWSDLGFTGVLGRASFALGSLRTPACA